MDHTREQVQLSARTAARMPGFLHRYQSFGHGVHPPESKDGYLRVEDPAVSASRPCS